MLQMTIYYNLKSISEAPYLIQFRRLSTNCPSDMPLTFRDDIFGHKLLLYDIKTKYFSFEM